MRREHRAHAVQRALRRVRRQARERGFPLAADPSQQLAIMDGAQIRSLVEGARFLFCNEYEKGLLESKTGWSSDEVLSRVEYRVTTRDANGVVIEGRDGSRLEVPVVPATQIADPTGVGDGFRAGFLAGIDGGLSLERAAQLGALIATLVLESDGPQDWTWDRGPALERLGDAYGPDAAAEIAPVVPA